MRSWSGHWLTTIQRCWEKTILGRCASTLLFLAVAAFAQTPESPARAYRDSPNPARRRSVEQFAAGHKDANGALAHLNLGIASFEQRQFADSIQHLKSAQAKLTKLA